MVQIRNTDLYVSVIRNCVAPDVAKIDASQLPRNAKIEYKHTPEYWLLQLISMARVFILPGALFLGRALSLYMRCCLF
jgi:hypothetical protein